jgi:hypothetical protein
VPALETISKRAAAFSVIVITVLQIAVHPDMTLPLQALSTLALVAGWLAARASGDAVHAVWVCVAAVSPALLRYAAGREGPVLDTFWMAGLSASLLRTQRWSQWQLGEGTRLFAGAWALIVSLAWPILVARELGFDPRVMWDLGAINSSGSVSSAPQAVSWILFICWTHLLGVLWLDWLAGWWARQPERMPTVTHGLWIGALLATGVAIYQGLFDIGFASTPFWAARSRATGSMLDANAYGMCAAIAGPIAFTVLRARGHAATGGVVMAAMLAGVWMSGSRNAMIAAIVGTAAVVTAVWRFAGASARRRLPLALAAAAALVAVVILFSGATGPLSRLRELSQETSGGLMNAVLSRGEYGETAMAIIRDYPVVGIGLGSYQLLSADYWRQMANDALAFDTAQNWWRHQLTELGVIGALPLFLWSAVMAWTTLTARARTGREFETTVIRGLVIAIGLASFIHVPTQTPLVLLWFFLLVAWLRPMTTERHSTISALPWMAVAALAIAYAAGQAVLARGSLAVPERAARFERSYATGLHGLEPLEGGGTFTWTRQRATFVWPARTRWLVVRVWAHHPDIASNPVALTLTTPCATLLDERLTSGAPVSVGIVLPEGARSVEAELQVSRTWRPADFGGSDRRELGAGITADFVETRAIAKETTRQVELTPCPPGGL